MKPGSVRLFNPYKNGGKKVPVLNLESKPLLNETPKRSPSYGKRNNKLARKHAGILAVNLNLSSSRRQSENGSFLMRKSSRSGSQISATRNQFFASLNSLRGSLSRPEDMITSPNQPEKKNSLISFFDRSKKKGPLKTERKNTNHIIFGADIKHFDIVHSMRMNTEHSNDGAKYNHYQKPSFINRTKEETNIRKSGVGASSIGGINNYNPKGERKL